MNGASLTPGDDELHAYLDGEIEPRRRGAIEAYLMDSPADAARVAGWRRQRQELRAAFGAIEAEPAPASILLAPPPARRRARLRLLRAGASGGDAAKSSAKSAVHSPSSSAPTAFAAKVVALPFAARAQDGAGADRWRADAHPLALLAIFAAGAAVALCGVFLAGLQQAPPAAHLRLAPASAHRPTMAARTLAALSEFRPQGIDAPAAAHPAETALIVPNLSSAGFRLIGMRAAPEGAPDGMVCLFYAKTPAPTVALCIARDLGAGRASASPQSASPTGDGGAIGWRQADALYSLAGPLDPGALRDLADRVSAEIAGFN